MGRVGGGGGGGSLVMFKVEHMHSYVHHNHVGLSSFSFPTLGNMLSVYVTHIHSCCTQHVGCSGLSLLTLLWDVSYMLGSVVTGKSL